MKLMPLLIAGLLLAGCAKHNETSARVAALEEQVSALASKLKELESQEPSFAEILEKEKLNHATEQIKELLAFRNIAYQVFERQSSAAVLNIGDSGYALARNDHGVFAISINNAAPYLDGHKVTLNIGNTTGATMRAVAVEASLPHDLEAIKLAAAAGELVPRRSFSAKLAGDLRAGVWTKVEVIMPGTKPEDLRSFYVNVTCGGVSLAN